MGMFNALDIQVLESKYKGAVLDIRLPEQIIHEEPALKERMRVVFDRLLAAKRSKLHMMDVDSPLMRYLFKKAKEYSFGGMTAIVNGLNGEAFLTAVLRWQNDQGQRIRQEYTALLLNYDGSVTTNPEKFGEWLKGTNVIESTLEVDRNRAKKIYELSEKTVNTRLGKMSTKDLHPENRQWITAGWITNDAQP